MPTLKWRKLDDGGEDALAIGIGGWYEIGQSAGSFAVRHCIRVRDARYLSEFRTIRGPARPQALGPLCPADRAGAGLAVRSGSLKKGDDDA